MISVNFRILNREHIDDVALLQRCIDGTPAYWRRITGNGPDPQGAQKTFEALPPGKVSVDKFVLGFFVGDEIVGIADLIRGFPNAETAMLGLLIVRESFQRGGIGKRAFNEIAQFIQRDWPEVSKVRIGVIAVNEPTFRFWRSLGFVETGDRKPYCENNIVSENVVLEKSLLFGEQ